MAEKFTLSNFKRALGSPSLILRELSVQGVEVNRRWHDLTGPDAGLEVMAEEWDNLLILDACRFDVYDEIASFSGPVRKVRSKGSHSTEFIDGNFADGEYHDTVYVSANPHVNKLEGEGVFHDIINVFDERWNEEYRTVLPEDVVAATLDAHEKYPRKRIISHFMQPHTPFIGEIGQSVRDGGLTGAGAGDEKIETGDEVQSIWHQLRYGLSNVETSTVWDAYVENLEIVLPHVETLFEELDGKTAITADHGNLFGERLSPLPVKAYGHPPGVRAGPLVEVPWHELPYESRREVVAETPKASTAVDEETVKQRLADLGYVNDSD